jgi:catechol 2,3-dioxygenase-like lactoylglutathione lyase family enzyme
MMRIGIAGMCLALALVGCEKRERRSPLARAAAECSHEGELSCPRPIFSVADLRATARYYVEVLGFKLDWTYGDPPDFASVSRGHATLFLCQGCPGQPGAWAMIFTGDVDRLYEEIRARKARIRMAPTDMPWGVREMHVADLDGNVLRIGSGIDDD